jgi:hypothetical protein
VQEDAPESEKDEPNGEDIEGVEYNRQEESEDEETSQDRDMMDDSTQDPIDPLIAYAQINADMEEDGSEDNLENPKRRLPEAGADQAAPPRRRSYQLEASQKSEPETPPETEGAEPTEAVDREPTMDLSQPEFGDPPFTEDQEDDDAMLEYFGDVCRIHIIKVRRICSPLEESSSRLHSSFRYKTCLAQTACSRRASLAMPGSSLEPRGGPVYNLRACLARPQCVSPDANEAFQHSFDIPVTRMPNS